MAESDAGARSGSTATEISDEAVPVVLESEVIVNRTRWSRLRQQWDFRLDPVEQSALLSWAAFTATFTGLRVLTHWIRDGHGPKGGGMTLGGKHFHHYNIGIALLAVIGGVGLRGSDTQRRHPAAAIAYGSATALVIDELALLLDLEDVYWSADGRKSVDVAVGVIATGATVFTWMPFWAHAHRAFWHHR